MQLFKVFLFSFFLVLSLSFTGCQGNNSDSTSSSSNSTSSSSSSTNSSSTTTSNSVTKLPKLHMENPNITITKNAESVNVKVLAYYSDGTACDKGSVIVKYPAVVVDGNVSAGTFAQSEVNVVNGQAEFTFTGPDRLISITPLNFTFVYSDNTEINTTFTVKYIPDVPKIVINDNYITVTQNGEIATIDLNVFNKDNSPYNGGNIKIKYPSTVLNSKDVGSFNVSSVPVVNGKAEFIYTAPNPLNGKDSNIFTFYHDSQPILSEKDLNISIVPVAGQVVLTNYVLGAIYDTNMPLETTKGMTFYVEDENGAKLADSNVISMKVTVLNPALGTLEDTTGNSGASLTVNGKNNVQINIKSNTLSGLIPIKVYTEFKDANNDDKNLTKVVNIVVHSGPPTAMSLSYAGTSQNADNAKFIENWVLTVTDKYNNLVNTTPSISMGAIVGYAKSSDLDMNLTKNPAEYLYYNSYHNSSPNDGNLTNDTFDSKHKAFGNVDLVNDHLVLFGGDGYKFHTFGKWDIDSIDSNATLSLKDDYNGSAVSGLTYAVGHNFRNEVCSGSPVVANVYAKDHNNTLGTTGSMIIQVEYDYYLVGKSVVLWTNLVGDANNTAVKIGLGKKVTLRGKGLTGESYSYAKGFTGVVRLNIDIPNTVEYYHNANFAYTVEVSGDGTKWHVQGDSMSDGNITDCSLNSGVAYVDVNISDSNTSGGTINLVNVLPTNEF